MTEDRAPHTCGSSEVVSVPDNKEGTSEGRGTSAAYPSNSEQEHVAPAPSVGCATPAQTAASPPRQNQATTTTEATMDDECIRELREAVERVKSLDKAVELPYWDDWSVTLAEGVEKLLAVAQPWFELREKAAVLSDSVPPNSDAARLAQEQIDFVDEQLRRLDGLR